MWDHLRVLCKETQAQSGSYVGRKLTYEHVNLTSFSKMKVNLAVQVHFIYFMYMYLHIVNITAHMQVSSSSVSHAFELMDNEEYAETAKFCRMFDRFFDCLNTRNAVEGKHKRKPDLDPYRSDKDARLKVPIFLYFILFCTCTLFIIIYSGWKRNF